MKFPVTLQFVVRTADAKFWLYEKKTELNTPPYPGLYLIGHAPNITGPNSNFDNMVRAVVDDGRTNEVLVKVQGATAPAELAEEYDKHMPEGWVRTPEPLAVPGSPGNELDQLFNG